jgi:hypothetical protein
MRFIKIGVRVINFDWVVSLTVGPTDDIPSGITRLKFAKSACGGFLDLTSDEASQIQGIVNCDSPILGRGIEMTRNRLGQLIR